MRVNEETQTDTRRRLLEAAADTFAERGYHGTRIDSVSQRAGVAKGTIYNYFPSKGAVLETLVAEACLLAAEAALATPEDASDPGPPRGVRRSEPALGAPPPIARRSCSRGSCWLADAQISR